MPIDGVVLQMKSMGIDAIVNFPFPTPPDRQALYKAEKILTYLGALRPSDSSESSQITDLGRAMSLFPLSPRFSRMLVSSQQHGCLPFVICIVSALAVGDPFISPEFLEDEVPETEASSRGLRDDASMGKEAQRRLRKAFYQSQQVSLNVRLGLFLKIADSCSTRKLYK
jgi:ATP-dependent RNA helicase DHX37/DHR1